MAKELEAHTPSGTLRCCRARTYLRLEWINIFNRPEFVTPVPAFGIPVFGRLESTEASIPGTFRIMARFDC